MASTLTRVVRNTRLAGIAERDLAKLEQGAQRFEEALALVSTHP